MVRIAMGFPFFEINKLFIFLLFMKFSLTESHSVIISTISSVICKVRRLFPLPITVSFLFPIFTSFTFRPYTSPTRRPRSPYLYYNWTSTKLKIIHEGINTIIPDPKIGSAVYMIKKSFHLIYSQITGFHCKCEKSS